MTPWTIFRLSIPFMGVLRQEYWSGLPFPSPGDLPDPGMELESTHTLLEKKKKNTEVTLS